MGERLLTVRWLLWCMIPSIALAYDIPVTHFTPVPLRITLDSLPQPHATESLAKSPKITARPARPLLHVPPGFRVSVYAEGLDHPRWLALSPEGDVLVTETPKNRIRRLHDNHGQLVITDFAIEKNGLNKPFGMAFSQSYFFLGNTDSVLRFPYKKGQMQLAGKGEKIATLPTGGHWTRNVILSPDGAWLYVAVGSASNNSEEQSPRASILRMRIDGSESSVFASGLRNPIGLAFHPVTQQLYATVNERDGLGDDLVPDYFTEVKQGGFYGWPYAYLSPKYLDPELVKNGRSLAPELAGRTITPDVLFAAHSAVMATVFSSGTSLPKHYQNGAFVAMRGSWNRSAGTGYKIVFVPFSGNQPAGYYEDFLTGFLLKPDIPETWGRPVGMVFLPDGSLLFADETGGRIFRIIADAQ
jgi:glucose/arabinose dehydrogenase